MSTLSDHLPTILQALDHCAWHTELRFRLARVAVLTAMRMDAAAVAPSPLTVADTIVQRAIRTTEALLQRAAEIDPKAWASPMPTRMSARRQRSYEQAVWEAKGRGERIAP